MNFLPMRKLLNQHSRKGFLLRCMVCGIHQDTQNAWESGTPEPNAEHVSVPEVTSETSNYFKRGLPLSSSEYQAMKNMPPCQPPNPHFLKVAILGEPNAGKSTLINSLLKWKVCAVSRKVHTTRQKAALVMVEGNKQIVFVDTPGFVTPEESVKHNLQISLVADPISSVREADLIAVIVDAANKWTNKRIHEDILTLLVENRNKKSILILNKVDAQKRRDEMLVITRLLSCGAIDGVIVNPITKAKAQKRQLSYEKMLAKTAKIDEKESIVNIDQPLEHFEGAKGWPFFSRIFMVSALLHDGVDALREYLFSVTKPGEWIYHDCNIVDKHPYEIALLTVREVLLETLPQEIPYNLILKIKNWAVDERQSLRIHIAIICPKPHYRRIVIGKSGARIASFVETARHALQATFRCEIFLRLAVELQKEL